MDDLRYLGIDEDDEWHIPDDERDYSTAPEDEVPFHIPRD
jgi:hypothetical protein